MVLGQTNFDRALTQELRMQAKLAVMHEYTFDFLETWRETLLSVSWNGRPSGESKIFCAPLGGLFTFVGSQFRLEVEDKEYFNQSDREADENENLARTNIALSLCTVAEGFP